MQYLENDMDELFRKAAEKYPLKTDGDDWDKIAPALANSGITELSRPQSKRRYSLLFLLGFLLLTSTGIVLYFNQGTGSKAPLSTAKAAEIEARKSLTRHSEASEPGHSPVTTVPNESFNRISSPTPKNLKSPKSPSSGLSGFAAGTKAFSTSKNRDAISLIPVNSSIQNQSPGKTAYAADRNSGIPLDERSFAAQLLRGRVFQTADTDSSQSLSLPKKPIGKGTVRNPGFYFGLMSGPQFNQVKGQGFGDAGLSSGLLIGYRVNKRISFESGLFYTQKHYYSEGKYFDMDKVSPTMPSGMQVLSLTGNSTVFEIPLKLKYDFLQKGNHQFFSTVGISSYLLKRETNDYLTLVNGIQQHMAGNYQNATKYLAASVNFSAGYSHTIGKKVSLRIEPYVQIPVRGLGIGSMPVSSAGLHIGIVWDRK